MSPILLRRKASFLFIFAVLFGSNSWADKYSSLITLNVSGANGSDGASGSDYGGSTASTSSDGRDGGDATSSGAGQNAGSIDLKLADPNGDGVLTGVVMMTATVKDADGRVSNQNGVNIEYGKSGFIYLQANGGKGGNGGNGGDGGRGGRGRNGDDATETRNGEDGGPGGNGGDGGLGSNGSNAGDGGALKIHVSKEDAGLLMLVKPSVAGGRGGSAGNHGHGGAGGSGGSGGSSHTWYTYENYTDSQNQQQTRSIPHTNWGGSSGSSGRSGRTPISSLSSGADGRVGNVEYLVKGETGEVHYDSIYSLKLIDFTFEETDLNGIFEPGETVKVSHVKVKNVGGMPTPENQAIKVYLGTDGWVVADGVTFSIPHSLAPGEEYTIPLEFPFTVKQTTIETDGARFETDEYIRPIAEVTQVDRIFEEFNLSKIFHISFPVQLSKVKALKSLSAGQTTKVQWELTNISSKPLGLDSTFRRQIQTHLKLDGGDIDPYHMKFFNPQGQEVDLITGYRTDVPLLGPGDTILIEGVLKTSPDAKPYTSGILRTSLRMDTPGQRLNKIQNEIAELRISETYKIPEKPGILLVTNHGTTENEIKAWKKLAADLDQSLTIWDISYYGSISLTEQLKDSGSTLENDFKGKTIILLNNQFDAAGNAVRTEDMIARKEFLHAAGENGINFLALGGNSSDQSILENYLVPTLGEARDHATLKDFLKSLKDADRVSEPEVFGKNFDRWQVSEWFMWGKPKVEQLQKRSEKLFRKLSKLAPEDRNFLVYSFKPEQTGESFGGLIKHWKLGDIEIRRGINSRVGLGMSVGLTDEALHRADTVLGTDITQAVIMALTPKAKVDLVQKAISNSIFAESLDFHQLIAPLVRSIAAEVAVEQTPFREIGASKSKIQKGMQMLKLLSELEGNGNMTASSASGKLANQLVAELHAISDSQMSWYDHLAPWSTKRKVSRIVRAASYDLIDKFYPSKLYQQEASLSIDLLKLDLKKEFKVKGQKKSELGMKRFLGPVTGGKVSYGSLSPNADLEIMTEAQYQSVLNTEHAQTLKSESFKASMEQERCSMLIED